LAEYKEQATMSFPTLTISGTVSGMLGSQSNTGTFSATITSGANGALSGTWTLAGSYSDPGAGISGTENVSGTLTGTGGSNGPWTLTLSGADLINPSLTLTYANGQYTLGISATYDVAYTVDYYGQGYTYHDQFRFSGQLVAGGPAPSGNTEGNDAVAVPATGSVTLDGLGGTDTAVFADARAAYGITANSDGSFTVAHTGTADVDTLAHFERLQFSDQGVAFDVSGHAGQAYRLYKAAFDRVPDVGGLGFQMNALDSGLTLSQVAGNFIASPEFQATYGSVDNTAFITLLYQNVLDRAPDAGGLQFHLNELANGETRADLLTHFSESPENQANVIGQIQAGMVYVPV
jgi:hypothetical protein